MVRLKGPLHSARARGTLAGALTYRHGPRGPVATRRPVPHNPNAPRQIRHRNHYAWLAQQWASLTPAELATWPGDGLNSDLPPYGAYLASALHRWKTFHGPSRAYPPREILPAATHAYLAPIIGPDFLTIQWSVTESATNWAWFLWFDDAPAIPIGTTDPYAHIITPGNGTKQYTISHLDPITYYWRLAALSNDGQWSIDPQERSATVGVTYECPHAGTVPGHIHAAWTYGGNPREHTWDLTAAWNDIADYYWGATIDGDYRADLYVNPNPARTLFATTFYYRYQSEPWRQAVKTDQDCTIAHPHHYVYPPWTWQTDNPDAYIDY